MPGRLRQLLLILLAAITGFALGSGPFFEWLSDVANMFREEWVKERLARGPSGTVPVLIAGFLLGQGVFLIGRQLISRIGPARARQIERVASWDPAVAIGTRFGLHQYLQRCAAWSAEDPTARIQTLALFKIRGLGSLNDVQGTLATTLLLQRVAAELRSASKPDSVSSFRRWYAHHFPRPLTVHTSRPPPARYPARWSGAGFALAFRELDALQAVVISRNVAAWIRRELGSYPEGANLSLSVTVVVGRPGSSGRSLASAASQALAKCDNTHALVLIDPADLRTEAIAQLNGVRVERSTVQVFKGDPITSFEGDATNDRLTSWLKSWGSGIGCLVSSWALLQFTTATVPTATLFPWPDTLSQIQVVDGSGTRWIKLRRQSLQHNATSNWKVTDGRLVQGDVNDGAFGTVQVQVRLENTSQTTYFVCPSDFALIDAAGHSLAIDEIKTLRTTNGLSGSWMRPGDTRVGWLIGVRGTHPIVALAFNPDRVTRLRLAAAVESDSPGSTSERPVELPAVPSETAQLNTQR